MGFDKLLLLLKVSRPVFWEAAPLVFLLGIRYAGAGITPLAAIELVLLSFPYCIILYGINDIYDYRSDRVNPRKKLIEVIKLSPKYRGHIKKASAYAAALLALSALATSNAANILAMLLLLFFSYYYSAPPLRFKVHPPLDSFANGMGYLFLPFLLGFSFGKNISEIPLKIYFITAGVIAGHAFSTIQDYSVDKKAGDRTFAVAFGKRAAAFAAFAVFVSIFLFAGIKMPLINYYLIISGLMFLVEFIFPQEKLAALLVRAEVAAFVLISAMILL